MPSLESQGSPPPTTGRRTSPTPSFAPVSAPSPVTHVVPPVAAPAPPIQPPAASPITRSWIQPAAAAPPIKTPSPARQRQPVIVRNLPPSPVAAVAAVAASGTGGGDLDWRMLLLIFVPAAVVGVASVILVLFLRRRTRKSPGDRENKINWSKDAFYEVGRKIKHGDPGDPPHENPPPLPRHPPFRHPPKPPIASSPSFHLPPPAPPSMIPASNQATDDNSSLVSDSSSSIENSRCWFAYRELEEATEGFSEASKLGEGRYGSMHKGCLANGKPVAIKLLKAGGWQNEQEFQAEVEIINRIHHKNLISLVGCCITGAHKILVYSYVPNGSLGDHLHGSGSASLDWVTRQRIAIGAARGIAYLHEDCHPRIIHRDIRPGNILVDGNFEAVVSGFGMARLASDSQAYLTTHVTGSIGYLAPEYISSGRLTDKSDVYAFGVVLLELVTGRKAVDPSLSPGKESLVEWARPLLVEATAGSLDGFVDPRLHAFDERGMVRMIKTAEACIRVLPSTRPKMIQVIRLLEGNEDNVLQDLRRGTRPGYSSSYDSSCFYGHKKSAVLESLDYTSDCSIETSEYGIAVSPSSSDRRSSCEWTAEQKRKR